jgi:5S rRNA maturation endonuclease (ribonuclease M5)
MSNVQIRIDIRSWLERKFEEVKTATWPDVAVCCPYCADTRYRLYVAIADGKKVKQGQGWCHNEGASHNFYELYRDLENLTDAEAHEHLYTDDAEPVYGKASTALAAYETKKVEQPVQDNLPVRWPAGYVPLYNLSEADFDKKLPAYVRERKLDKKLCDKYLLGYSTNDYQHAGRLIVPIYQNEILVGYQGRAMHPGIVPKYRFMDGIVAGEYLFNLDNVPSETTEAILVEGVFDVWGMIRCGYPNTIASFGKHLTPRGVKTLVGRFKSVLLMWDSDAKKEIVKLAEHLEGMIELKVTFLAGKDPDEAEIEDVKKAVEGAFPFDRSFKRAVLMER